MPESPADWLRNEEHSKFRNRLLKALSRGHVLLHDASGKPVLKNSDLWVAAEVEWQRATQRFLDELLRTLQLQQAPPSPEELITALRNLAETDPKYKLDVADGKLSLPIVFKVGSVSLKGHS